MSNLFTWQVHGDGKTLKPGEVVEPDERLTWPRTAEIGAQHVIAMFGATFLVPILTGFDPSTTLFFTAMSTALFLLINKNVLPSYLGSSFGFIAPITAVTTANKGIAVASFGILVTGLLLALIGVLVHFAGAKWIDIIMPPVVNGAIVAIIGFNLAPSVWNNFKVAPDTAIVTLVAVLLVAVLFKGLIGRLNILIGVIIGYAYACIRGQVDFSAIGDAAWVGLPTFHLPQVDFTILPSEGLKPSVTARTSPLKVVPPSLLRTLEIPLMGKVAVPCASVTLYSFGLSATKSTVAGAVP